MQSMADDLPRTGCEDLPRQRYPPFCPRSLDAGVYTHRSIHHSNPYSTAMGLIILRCIFVLVAAGLGVSACGPKSCWKTTTPLMGIGVFVGIIALALATIGLDVVVRRKRIETISAVFFGLLIGLLTTTVLGLAWSPLMPDPPTERKSSRIMSRSWPRGPFSATSASAS